MMLRGKRVVLGFAIQDKITNAVTDGNLNRYINPDGHPGICRPIDGENSYQYRSCNFSKIVHRTRAASQQSRTAELILHTQPPSKTLPLFPRNPSTVSGFRDQWIERNTPACCSEADTTDRPTGYLCSRRTDAKSLGCNDSDQPSRAWRREIARTALRHSVDVG